MILEKFYNRMRNVVASFHTQDSIPNVLEFGDVSSATTFQESNGALTGVSVFNNTDVVLFVLVTDDTTLTVSPTEYTIPMEPQSLYETPYNSKLGVTGILAAGASIGGVAITSFFNNHNRS